MNAFDVIIIGFGKGGKTLAAEFAKRGRKVAIVERSDKMYGGTCINIGCIPTKTLVHQAKIASGMKDATFEERSEFYRNAISVKEAVTSALRNKNYHNLADNPNVTVYTGVGSFVSSDVVSVRTSTEEIMLTSKQIIINTGAETVIPPIDGVAGNPLVYTSTSIMELTELPRRLFIRHQQIDRHNFDIIFCQRRINTIIVRLSRSVQSIHFRNGRSCDICIQNTDTIALFCHQVRQRCRYHRFTDAAFSADNADHMFHLCIFIGSHLKTCRFIFRWTSLAAFFGTAAAAALFLSHFQTSSYKFILIVTVFTVII